MATRACAATADQDATVGRARRSTDEHAASPPEHLLSGARGVPALESTLLIRAESGTCSSGCHTHDVLRILPLPRPFSQPTLNGEVSLWAHTRDEHRENLPVSTPVCSSARPHRGGRERVPRCLQHQQERVPDARQLPSRLLLAGGRVTALVIGHVALVVGHVALVVGHVALVIGQVLGDRLGVLIAKLDAIRESDARAVVAAHPQPGRLRLRLLQLGD